MPFRPAQGSYANDAFDWLDTLMDRSKKWNMLRAVPGGQEIYDKFPPVAPLWWGLKNYIEIAVDNLLEGYPLPRPNNLLKRPLDSLLSRYAIDIPFVPSFGVPSTTGDIQLHHPSEGVGWLSEAFTKGDSDFMDSTGVSRPHEGVSLIASGEGPTNTEIIARHEAAGHGLTALLNRYDPTLKNQHPAVVWALKTLQRHLPETDANIPFRMELIDDLSQRAAQLTPGSYKDYLGGTYSDRLGSEMLARPMENPDPDSREGRIRSRMEIDPLLKAYWKTTDDMISGWPGSYSR